MERSTAVLRAGIKARARLADDPVHGVRRQLPAMRIVDAEHVSPERAQHPGPDRAGDDPGQIKDLQPRSRQLACFGPQARPTTERRHAHKRRREVPRLA
jgi:hypothetical protein